MEAVTYSTERVGRVLNEGAVPVALDFDVEEELAAALGVRAIPAGVFVNPDTGRAFDRVSFSEDPEGFAGALAGILERYRQARSDVERARAEAAARPEDPLAAWALAEMLRAAAGSPEEIEAEYDRAARLDPEDSSGRRDWALFRLAGVRYERDGDGAKADEALAAALDPSADDPELHGEVLYALGSVNLRRGETARGVAFLERLVAERPEHPRARAVVEAKILERFR